MKAAKELVEEANSHICAILARDALQLLKNPNTVFIDLRESVELQENGKIPGSVHAPRGMLEFLIDPTSSDHNSVFSSGRHLVFYCASGGRSALAASTAQLMGLKNVAHIDGGFRAWTGAGGPIE